MTASQNHPTVRYYKQNDLISEREIMSTKAKSKPKKAKNTPVPANIVWFEIPADDIKRAKTFYGKLFGWKITKFPGPMTKEYWHIDTGGSDDSPDGGLMERQHPQHSITNYINVASVDRAAANVEKLGGKICMPRRRSRKWATSLSARTRKTTCSPSGRKFD